jgi:hypothetical protein
MRGEFLEQVRLWNRIEDLPKIRATPSSDGSRLRYLCADYRRQGLRKLVGSYGGRITREEGTALKLESEFLATAFDWS